MSDGVPHLAFLDATREKYVASRCEGGNERLRLLGEVPHPDVLFLEVEPLLPPRFVIRIAKRLLDSLLQFSPQAFSGTKFKAFTIISLSHGGAKDFNKVAQEPCCSVHLVTDMNGAVVIRYCFAPIKSFFSIVSRNCDGALSLL
jgi:hypothetical protein